MKKQLAVSVVLLGTGFLVGLIVGEGRQPMLRERSKAQRIEELQSAIRGAELTQQQLASERGREDESLRATTDAMGRELAELRR